jgi:transposase
MAQLNTIGVDLAKNVIQVSVVTPRGKELSNKALTRKKFSEFLIMQTPSLVGFEACATAHHWARIAKEAGHTVRILPAVSVAPFRQGHKTDQNDALAVAEAAVRPHIKEAPLKSLEQQGLQAIQRSREMLIRDRTAVSNHIRGLLLEFGIAIPKGFCHLHRAVPDILEDGENGVPDMFRPTLNLMHQRLVQIKRDIDQLTQQIESLVKANDACQRLLDIEGVGPISAVLLYATLGSGEAFHNGREFSAYLGLTPKQYSSGGKTNLIGISRYVANKRLRAVLIQGARAYVYRIKEPKTPKDKWLLAMVDRAGYGKASVALANKNVRTAWAMLTRGTEYNRLEGLAA